MELAMQFISYDRTVRSNTAQDLKESNSQSLATQAKKEEQLLSMMLDIKKACDFLGDDKVEFSTKNEPLKCKIGSFDENWSEESKAKLLKQIDDEKRANLIMSGMQKQMEKTLNIWLIQLIINCRD